MKLLSPIKDLDTKLLWIKGQIVNLGKPSPANSAVFLTLFKGGWGVKPMFKNVVANILLSKGLFGNIKST